MIVKLLHNLFLFYAMPLHIYFVFCKYLLFSFFFTKEVKSSEYPLFFLEKTKKSRLGAPAREKPKRDSLIVYTLKDERYFCGVEPVTFLNTF